MQVADVQNVIFLELISSPITHEAAFLLPDCKSAYPGSIPTSASTIRKPRRLMSAGFFFVGWKTPVPLKNTPSPKTQLTWGAWRWRRAALCEQRL